MHDFALSSRNRAAGGLLNVYAEMITALHLKLETAPLPAME